MIKRGNILLWTVLLSFASFADFGRFCRHGNFTDQKQFTFRDNAKRSDEYQYISGPLSDSSVLPSNIGWELLENLSLEKRFNKEYQMDIMYPVFGKLVKEQAGKNIYLTGYMIPLDIPAGIYALSRVNYASCFFCGGAGAESVISLKFRKPPRRYKTDEYLTMKGTLVLNDSNAGDFVYILKNAEEYKP